MLTTRNDAGSLVDALRDAQVQALAWWAQLEAQAVAEGATSSDEALRPYLPMGPASHPRVLQVLRLHAAAIAVRSGHHPLAHQRLVEHLQETDPSLMAFVEELLLFPDERPLPKHSAQPESGLEQPRAFRFELIHHPARGITRLTGASRRMPSLHTVARPVATFGEAPLEYQRLFFAYEQHLEAALSVAEQWWAEVIDTTMAHHRVGASQAAALAFDQHFGGPAGCPELQWTIHRYWTECVRLNARTDVSCHAPPESLLLEWLQDDNHPGWLEAVSCLPYWPIGLDGAGRWQ